MKKSIDAIRCSTIWTIHDKEEEKQVPSSIDFFQKEQCSLHDDDYLAIYYYCYNDHDNQWINQRK